MFRLYKYDTLPSWTMNVICGRFSLRQRFRRSALCVLLAFIMRI